MLFLLLLVFVIADKVNYYDLALKKCKNNNSWSIHGLWPEYTVHSWPQFCDPTRYNLFNKSVVESFSFYDDLVTNWYSCTSESSYSLWENEWQKHGTCTKLSPQDYFLTVVDLFHTLTKYQSCCDKTWNQCLMKLNLDYNWQGTCTFLQESVTF